MNNEVAQKVHRCVADLNAAITAAQEARFRVNADIIRWDIGKGVKSVWIEVLQPIPPDELVSVAIGEEI